MFLPRNEVKRIGPWVDMPFLNAMRMATGHPLHDLGFKYNYIGSLAYHDERPFDPDQAFVVHASGGLSAIHKKQTGEELSAAQGIELRCAFLRDIVQRWNASIN